MCRQIHVTTIRINTGNLFLNLVYRGRTWFDEPVLQVETGGFLIYEHIHALSVSVLFISLFQAEHASGRQMVQHPISRVIDDCKR